MSDSTVHNLLKRSCFSPTIANKLNDMDTLYTLGDDGWVSGVGYDSRRWTADFSEWAVTLPVGTYTLFYEVDGTQGAVWDNLSVFLGDKSVCDSVGHHDGPYSHALTFALDSASTARIMAKCYAPARYRLMLVEGTTPAAWAPAEGETLAGGVRS